MSNTIDDPVVHERDYIFRFIAEHPAHQGEGVALRTYQESGADLAARLRALILGHLKRDDISLLEFAAGYGCVTRHLPTAMPRSNITACDIHDEAVDFIATRFGVESIGSTPNPDNYSIGRQFDVVFALSFFSHMPAATWSRWLKALARHVANDGVVIFTTHGLRSIQFLPDCRLDNTGFWFKPFSEQLDLDTSQYGSTITTPEFVKREIAKLDGFHLAEFHEGYWWGHQDLYVVRRIR